MKAVNAPIRKKDAMALVTGKPVYTNDIAPKDCLIVKVLRSPFAHALIREIHTKSALKVPGVTCILTYKDAPNSRFTTAGQTFPEPSPYDRYILDQRVRFIGDAVAIVAGESEKAVNRALKMIKVDYQELEPVLDFRTAKDNHILVHPEEDWKALCEVGADNKRNLVSSEVDGHGDLEAAFAKCDYIVEETYHTKANQQAMMEPFSTFTYQDVYGRLNVISSTQITFHVRRILANALNIPKSKIRVIKPRIGGGFGAKQSVVSEIYPALVTMKTGKPAKIVYTREECQIAASPRHEMEIKVKVGADKNGIIKAIDMYTLSNSGAYSEHGPTTVGLSGHKSIPLYAKAEAHRFSFDVVYTNLQSAGAYRGYGATQGFFAMESAVNELAAKIGMDPTVIREINMVKEGDVMPAYYGETATSCALDRCMAKAKDMIKWNEKYPCKDMGNGKIRSVGVAMCMQGSGISVIDTGAVNVKVNDDGFYSLMIGASDMGTGCDTILAQIMADSMDCHIDNIVVYGVDTDTSPYDKGSYASSTTYITGMAVVKACERLRVKIMEEGAKALECSIDDVDFDGDKVYMIKEEKSISLKDIANNSMVGTDNTLFATASHFSPVSPPPFMVGIAEVEIDKETGFLQLIDYAAVVDCGTVINPNLARVQAEGGIVQGIGMALTEEVTYSDKGRVYENSFMQYKIPSRMDIGDIRVEFESSYEPSGPFGAKSIGEVVINTPSPAIANAIANATGVQIRELPMTAEKIFKGIHGKE
ncbi:MAG TPA: molybdopterin-dependent oxidoreductase [Candidatus Merdenecus merdavium]|nr:molybdopterin-dependent oxidoreductase [Candidatus Merdenecus merdavium]